LYFHLDYLYFFFWKIFHCVQIMYTWLAIWKRRLIAHALITIIWRNTFLANSHHRKIYFSTYVILVHNSEMWRWSAIIHKCHPGALMQNMWLSCNFIYTKITLSMFVILTDIDECSDDTDECSVYGICTDLEPAEGLIGYSCQCKTGFTGDGFTCTSMYNCMFYVFLCSR
jgi:hypothetical protein